MNGRLSLWQRLKLAGGVMKRGNEALADVPAGIMPPSRAAACDPLALSTVFRGIQVLQTAITGLPIYETRAGLKLDSISSLVAQPDVNRSRRDFLADMVASMALDGNAFVRLVRFGGEIVSCEVLPPSLVVVSDDGSDPAAPKLRYSYLGKDYGPTDIVHCKFLNVPGRLRGLGPISAAREEVEGAKMARDYKARFYTDSSNLKGYLKTEQKVTPEYAKQAKNDWKAQGTAADVKYAFDAQGHGAIARLLGIPASIMLAAVDGSNLTYSNIEQSWIEFSDYTLSAYAGEIEELFNVLLPRGREARFDWDSSRRADMSDRFNAYKTALDSKWITVNEVRARESYPPLVPAPEPQQIGDEQ